MKTSKAKDQETRRQQSAWDRAKAAFGAGDIADAMVEFERWASPGPASMHLPAALTWWVNLSPREKMRAIDAFNGESQQESAASRAKPSIFIASDFRDHHVEGYLATEPGNINRPIRFVLLGRDEPQMKNTPADAYDAWLMTMHAGPAPAYWEWRTPFVEHRVFDLRTGPMPRFLLGLNYRPKLDTEDCKVLDDTVPCVEPAWAKAGAP